MDLHEIAEQIMAGAAKAGGGLRLRQATITNVAGDHTISVQIAGSSVIVSGVKVFESVTPSAGRGIWLITDGIDLIGIGMLKQP